MPVYQYKCRDCGKEFEINCHLSEREKLAKCPSCGKKNVQPVFTSFVTAPPPKY